MKRFAALLQDLWKGEIDVKGAVEAYREHKVPDKFCKDAVVNGLRSTLDKKGKVIQIIIIIQFFFSNVGIYYYKIFVLNFHDVS